MLLDVFSHRQHRFLRGAGTEDGGSIPLSRSFAVAGLFFRGEASHDFFEARVAAQAIPAGTHFQMTIV